MLTYIIKCQHYYKIGKATNLKTRLKGYATHNPDFEVIHTIPINCETQLHQFFKHKHFKLEWFLLDETDIEIIKQLEHTKKLKDKSKKKKSPTFKIHQMEEHLAHIRQLEEERIIKMLKGRPRCKAIKEDTKQCTAPASIRGYCGTHAKIHPDAVIEED